MLIPEYYLPEYQPRQHHDRGPTPPYTDFVRTASRRNQRYPFRCFCNMSIYDELDLALDDNLQQQFDEAQAAALKIQRAFRAYLATKYPDDGIDDDDDDKYDDDVDREDEYDEDDDEDDDGVERNPPVFYILPTTPSCRNPLCCSSLYSDENISKLEDIALSLNNVSLQRAVVETRAACNIQKAFRGYLARKYPGKFYLVNPKLDDYDTDSITSEDSSYYSEDSDDDSTCGEEEVALLRGENEELRRAIELLIENNQNQIALLRTFLKRMHIKS